MTSGLDVGVCFLGITDEPGENTLSPFEFFKDTVRGINTHCCEPMHQLRWNEDTILFKVTIALSIFWKHVSQIGVHSTLVISYICIILCISCCALVSSCQPLLFKP